MTSKKPISANNINVTGDFIAGDQYNYYYTGDFASLAEYYISPESVFQRVRTDDFIGRDWLTTKVDAFLNDPNRKSGAFLLIGDAGVGKTSFMAHLVKERRYLHLFAEQAPGQAMLQRAMQSLGSQLVTRYQIDPYKDRDTLNALSVFPDFLERILRLAASTLTEGEKIVIVCDALDEAGFFPDQFVFGLPKELPDGVYFILSQRPVNVKLPNFEPVIENLEAQGEGNLQDIGAYLSAVAKRPEVLGQIRSKEYSEEFFIQTLKEKSQGVWMYLHYIIKEIESGARAPLDLANLPTGLVGYYAEYWDAWRTGKRGKSEEAWDELYAPLLTTLAAAQEAIPVDRLLQWADVTAKPREVTRLLTEHWRAFITEKEVDGKKAYAPYHLSFKDFITGRVETSKLPPAQANLIKDLAAQTVDAHKRIVNAFEKECNGEWEKLVEEDYPRLHLTAHLNGAGEYEKLRMLLTEGDEKIKWAEAREQREETYAGYLNDLTYVWDYAEREQNYALAIRCMLIENSLHSLAENISPELLKDLVKTNIWSPARCLSIIKQKINPNEQASSLIEIASFIPENLQEEAIMIAIQSGNKEKLTYALAKFLQVFSKRFIPQLVAIILPNRASIKSLSDLFLTLSYTIPYITDENQRRVVVQEAIDIALLFEDDKDKAFALSKLAPYLSTEKKYQALSFVSYCDYKSKLFVLKRLFPYLDQTTKTKALAIAFRLPENSASELLSEISDYINSKEESNEEDHQKDVDESEKKRIVYLLKKSLVISGKLGKLNTLISLVPHLNDLTELDILSDILLSIKDNLNNFNQNQMILKVTPYLDGELRDQAILIFREIKNPAHRAEALISLGQHLPFSSRGEIIDEAITATRMIAREIRTNPFSDDYDQSSLVSKIIPFLTESQKEKILLLVHETVSENAQYIILSSLIASKMPSGFFNSTLQIAFEMKDEELKARIITLLIPHLDEHQKENISIRVEDIHSKYYQYTVMFTLAVNLPADKQGKAFYKAFSLACEIPEDDLRSKALSVIFKYLPTIELKIKAFSSASEILDPYHKCVVMVNIANTAKDQDNQLKENSLDEAISLIGEIKDKPRQISAIIMILPFLDADLAVEALTVVDNDFQKADMLFNIGLRVGGEQGKQMLIDSIILICEIKANKRSSLFESQIENLSIKIAPFLTNDMFENIVTKSSHTEIVYEYFYPYMDISLISRLPPDSLWNYYYRATYRGRKIGQQKIRDVIKSHNKKNEFAVFFQDKLTEIKLTVDNNGYCHHQDLAETLLSFWNAIEYLGLNEILMLYIRSYSISKRENGLIVITVLVPALAHFRGPEIVEELYRTITDVTRWWP